MMTITEKKAEALRSQVRKMITAEKEFPAVLVDVVNWEEEVKRIDNGESSPEIVFTALMNYARKMDVPAKIALAKECPMIKEHVMH